MADLKDLYQDVILDHYRNPRNNFRIEFANRQGEGLNPLCGDRFCIYLQIEGGLIRNIGFEGEGCAISLASASMMTEKLKLKTEDEAKAIHDAFLRLLTSPSVSQLESDRLGNLRVFSGVRDYPVRVKCATLAWQALSAALERRTDAVSTE